MVTLIFVKLRKFKPMAKIIIPPTPVKSFKKIWLIKGSKNWAPRKIRPCTIKTGAAANKTPIPMVEANIIEETPSKIDFAIRVSVFPVRPACKGPKIAIEPTQ